MVRLVIHRAGSLAHSLSAQPSRWSPSRSSSSSSTNRRPASTRRPPGPSSISSRRSRTLGRPSYVRSTNLRLSSSTASTAYSSSLAAVRPFTLAKSVNNRGFSGRTSSGTARPSSRQASTRRSTCSRCVSKVALLASFSRPALTTDDTGHRRRSWLAHRDRLAPNVARQSRTRRGQEGTRVPQGEPEAGRSEGRQVGEHRVCRAAHDAVRRGPEARLSAVLAVARLRTCARSFALIHTDGCGPQIYSKTVLCSLVPLFIGLSFLNAGTSIQGLQNQLFAIFLLFTCLYVLVSPVASSPSPTCSQPSQPLLLQSSLFPASFRSFRPPPPAQAR